MILSETQRAAVNHPGSLALVSCPGSGKTRTLVAKLLDALEQVHGTTRLIACITYTNAAVHEIESRLDRLSPSAAAHCEVETIHSFCLKHIVRPHSWHLTSFPNGFSVLAPEDPAYITLVEVVAETFKLSARARGDLQQLGRGTGAYPDSISKEVAASYWDALDRRCAMDFSSIIFWAARLVQDVPHIARGLASRYRWILVDEFQDTSSLQVEILRAIHRHDRTQFFIVGDPFQSIMSFAGARPELLTQFGAEIGARSDLTLLDNYRSSRHLTRIAEKLCPRDAPMVAAGVHRDYNHVPVWHAVSSMLDGVANTFIPEVKRRGISLSETAVLANRWTSLLPLSRGLRGLQIPVIGPGARPYKRSNHIIAPLVEEVAAHISELGARRFDQVRREVRRLIQTLTKAQVSELGFAGDVCSTRIVRGIQRISKLDDSAVEFLIQCAETIANELGAAGFLSTEDSTKILRSAEAMISDIVINEKAHRVRTTTVRDLGLFARGSNSVRLLTMHGSKGREFDAVALIDVFDGHVPHFTAARGDGIEAEGRRLLYVALTRAKKLVMIFTLAQPTNTKPSRFLDGLLPEGAQ